MKVWISKYALTKGIFEMDVRISEDGKSAYGQLFNECYHKKGIEWHEAREDAVRRAEEMRENKIRNLEKQIQKLKDMTFE